MSNIGYYRYKISDLKEGTSTLDFYVNGAKAMTATINTRKFCDGFKLLKYLDKSGKYRFFPFNQMWQLTDTPSEIGTINKFVTSILTSQSSTRSLGNKNTRKISLTAGNVSREELEILQDIYTSPAVYLYLSDGTSDEDKDWVFVKVSGDGIGRHKKNEFKKVNIDITLPEHYSIRL